MVLRADDIHPCIHVNGSQNNLHKLASESWQLVKKLFWDAEGGVPYKIIYEE